MSLSLSPFLSLFLHSFHSLPFPSLPLSLPLSLTLTHTHSLVGERTEVSSPHCEKGQRPHDMTIPRTLRVLVACLHSKLKTTQPSPSRAHRGLYVAVPAMRRVGSRTWLDKPHTGNTWVDIGSLPPKSLRNLKVASGRYSSLGSDLTTTALDESCSPRHAARITLLRKHRCILLSDPCFSTDRCSARVTTPTDCSCLINSSPYTILFG